MPRIRTIKPELFISETLSQLSLAAERTFTGLLTQADDKGRLRYSPAVLNGALWPCRPQHTVQDMVNDIQEILNQGLLCEYEVEGKKYLHFPTWDEHQKISHPTTRNLSPECPKHEANTSKESKKNQNSGNLPEDSGKTPQGKERKGKERKSPPIKDRGGVGGRIGTKKRSATPPATGANAPSVIKTTKPDKREPKQNDTSNNTTGKEEKEMGVYDTPVEPFTDLRKEGTIRKGKKAIGKNGVDPKYLPDVETIIEHFSEAHRKVGTKFRVTNTWYTDAQMLLRGTGAVEPFTVGQICDLIDFGMGHSFWHTHITNPTGLKKHGPKLFGSDDYVAWSLKNKRPEDNRPRNTLIKDSPSNVSTSFSSPRGKLAADAKRNAEDYKNPL